MKSKILFIIPIVIGVRSIRGGANDQMLREFMNEVRSFDYQMLPKLRNEVRSFDGNTPTENIVAKFPILCGLAESQYSKKLGKINPKQLTVVANLEKDYQKIQTRQQYLQWIGRKKDLIKLDHESYMQDKEYSKKSREASKSYYVCWKDMNPTLCKFDLAIERQRENTEKMEEIQISRATYIEYIQDMSRKLIEECDQDYQEMLMQVLNAVDQVLEANREIQPEEVERLQKLDRKSQGEEDMGVVGEQGVVDRVRTVGIIGISVPDVQQLREYVTKRGSNNNRRGAQFNELGKRILERQENVESAENLGTNTKNIKLPRISQNSGGSILDTENQEDNQSTKLPSIKEDLGKRTKLPRIAFPADKVPTENHLGQKNAPPSLNLKSIIPPPSNPKRAKHLPKLPPLQLPNLCGITPPVSLL